MCALHAAMHIGQRIAKIVSNVLIELVVLLLADLIFRTRPEGRRSINNLILRLFPFFGLAFSFHHNGEQDMIGIFANNGTQAIACEEIIFALAQVQHHFRATRGLCHVLNRVFALPVRLPAHTLLGSQTGLARCQRHFISNHKG